MLFLSRYPGEPMVLPPPVLALVPTIADDPDMVSIHAHHAAAEAGRFLVFGWVRDREFGWIQLGTPTNVPSMKNALEYVPPGAIDVTERSPAGWAEKVFIVR